VYYATSEEAAQAASDRTTGGQLHVSTVDGSGPQLENVITAVTRLGWWRVRDVNEVNEGRIGCRDGDHPRRSDDHQGRPTRIKPYQAFASSPCRRARSRGAIP
jgi:hypothetical protein